MSSERKLRNRPKKPNTAKSTEKEIDDYKRHFISSDFAKAPKPKE